MKTSYTYPHTQINVFNKVRSTVPAYIEDTSTLFVPFISDFGPVNEFKRIFSYSEFVSTYGEVSFEKQGQTALHIMNWLNNGGTLYAYRVCPENQAKCKAFENGLIAPAVLVNNSDGSQNGNSYAEAKYPGSYYIDNDISVELSLVDIKSINGAEAAIVDISIKKGVTVIESKRRINLNDYSAIKAYTDASEFISDLAISIADKNKFTNNTIKKLSLKFNYSYKENEAPNTIKHAEYSIDYYTPFTTQSNGSITAIEDYADAVSINGTKVSGKIPAMDIMVRHFYKNAFNSSISDRLLVPAQLILDAGYTDKTKEMMYKFIYSDNSARTDILLVLDNMIANYTTNADKGIVYTGSKAMESNSVSMSSTNSWLKYTNEPAEAYDLDEGNLEVFEGSCLINSSLAEKEIWVTPECFLAAMIPGNDTKYGYQYPIAGTERGKIQGILAIDKTLTPDDKQKSFSARFNYIEHTSKGYYFMTHRTFDYKESDYKESGLSFASNVRVKNLMVKELDSIGRDFLYEINDSTTLSNMSAQMNQYVQAWVQNRTLSYAYVAVEADPDSDERVNVQLNIKFKGHFELITLNITID